MKMDERDFELMRSLCELRYLTVSQIRIIVQGGTAETARRPVVAVWKGRLGGTDRLPEPWTCRSCRCTGYGKRCRDGFEIVGSELHLYDDVSPQFLRHLVNTNQSFWRLRRRRPGMCCRSFGTVPIARGFRSFKLMSDRRGGVSPTVPASARSGRSSPRRGIKGRRCFLELDRVTEAMGVGRSQTVSREAARVPPLSNSSCPARRSRPTPSPPAKPAAGSRRFRGGHEGRYRSHGVDPQDGTSGGPELDVPRDAAVGHGGEPGPPSYRRRCRGGDPPATSSWATPAESGDGAQERFIEPCPILSTPLKHARSYRRLNRLAKPVALWFSAQRRSSHEVPPLKLVSTKTARRRGCHFAGPSTSSRTCSG